MENRKKSGQTNADAERLQTFAEASGSGLSVTDFII